MTAVALNNLLNYINGMNLSDRNRAGGSLRTLSLSLSL